MQELDNFLKNNCSNLAKNKVSTLRAKSCVLLGLRFETLFFFSHFLSEGRSQEFSEKARQRKQSGSWFPDKRMHSSRVGVRDVDTRRGMRAPPELISNYLVALIVCIKRLPKADPLPELREYKKQEKTTDDGQSVQYKSAFLSS